MFPIMGFIGNLGYVVICILGSYLAAQKRHHGRRHPGLYIQYVRSFTQPLTQIANISNILQQTATPQPSASLNSWRRKKRSLTLRTLFTRNRSKGMSYFRMFDSWLHPDKVIIRDFSADDPGQKIAIVGPTGAGKTTMVKLLMRFYDVDGGVILIDGHNIKDFRREDLRCMFGMVLQDTWLYNDTIMENIRYGSPGASDDLVSGRSQAACVDHSCAPCPKAITWCSTKRLPTSPRGQKRF